MQEPLAFKIRPTKLTEYFGQDHLLGDDGIINKMIKNQKIFSMIFFGPPGVGKTTLAKIIANELKMPYREFNAVVDNKKRLEELFVEAKLASGLIIIIDEVHRLNKDKQDLLLPYIESGLITLIGATTANPYFSINPAIRSRVHLFELYPLSLNDIKKAIEYALTTIDQKLSITDEAIKVIYNTVNGDLRFAYNILEIASLNVKDNIIDVDNLKEYTKVVNNQSFKNDDGHYDLLSAFQKSIRGSDVNAALYYLALLLQSGDFTSVERRLLVIAYEDIGLANPALAARTINATETAKCLGYPENLIPLGLQVIELCLSPKSKSANNAIHKASYIANTRALSIPKYLKLNPIGLNNDEKYDYDNPNIWHKIQYLPDEIKEMEFYFPANNQYEKTLLDNYNQLKKYHRTNNLKALNKNKL